jgi:hypothetical protein
VKEHGTLYLDVGLALVAALAWAMRPNAGPWPLALIGAGMALRWFGTGRLLARSAFDWPMLVFLLTMAVAVWSAYDTAAAWAKFWLLVGGLGIYQAWANFTVAGPPDAGVRMGWILSAYGAATSTYWMAAHLLQVAFLVGTINANIAAGAMVLAIPFQVAIIVLQWRQRRIPPLMVGVALFALTFAGLVATQSRGAWLAVGLAASAVLWWHGSRWMAVRRERHAAYFFGGLAVALILGWVGLVVWSPELELALSQWTSADGQLDRASLYRDGLLLALDYPVIGAGLDSFMMLHASYALLTHVGFTTHGHDLYLNLSIEQGIFALLSLLWMWLIMLRAIWRSMRFRRVRKRSGAVRRNHHHPTSSGVASHRRLMVRVAGLALLTVAAHGLIDDAIYASRNAIFLFAPLAFAVPVLRKAPTPSRRQRRFVALGSLGIIVAVAAIWWRPISSRLVSNVAAVRQSKAELSLYAWPEWPVQDAVRRTVALEETVAGFRLALNRDPANASAGRRLGQIELSLGEYEEALADLELAYRHGGWAVATRQLLGEAYVVNGKVEEGAQLWAGVPNRQGQLSIRRFWYEHIGDESRAHLIMLSMAAAGSSR